MSRIITTKKIFDSTVITQNETTYSDALDLSTIARNGKTSLQVALTGSASVDMFPEISNDGETFLKATGIANFATTFLVTSGPGGDGKDLFEFNLKFAKWLRIGITEGDVAAGALTATLAVQ